MPHDVSNALAYLARMGVDEPDAWSVVRWIEDKRDSGAYDHKYTRRVIEALIVAKGGTLCP